MQKRVNLVDPVESFQTSIYYLLAEFGFDTAEAPRDPRRRAQGAPPPGSRDLRLLAVRESAEADAAWVHMTAAGHVEPVRPLALGAGRAAAWLAARATVRAPGPTPRRSSVVP